MPSYQRLTEVTAAGALSDAGNVIAEENGALLRVPASALRASSGGAITSYQNDLGLKVTKFYNVWNQAKAGLVSCYWTWVLRVDDKLADPLGRYYMWYSTDHAANAAQYIGLAYSNSLTGGWTKYGNVFHHYSEAAGAYVGDETPSVVWDAENQRFLMFSHANIGENGEAQSQYRSESTDGINWTNTVKAFANVDPTRLPGNLHNGYFMPFCFQCQWFGYSLMGGGSNGSALHWSEDGGYTWYTDHRQLGRWCLKDNDVWLYPNHSTVVTLRGQPYLLGMQSNFAAGTTAKIARIALTPMADLRTPFGKSYILVDPAHGNATYESDNLRTVTVHYEDGKVYVYYNCKVGGNWYNNCAVVEPVDQPVQTPTVTITGQPTNVSVQVGAAVRFTVAATASAGTLSYQWYYSDDGGATWNASNLASATTNTLIKTANDMDGQRWKCVVTSSEGASTTSNAAVMHIVAAAVSVTSQPQSARVVAGSIAGSLSCAATASDGSTVAYQWYSNGTASNAGGSAITGATGASMAIPADLAVGSYYYYCLATSATAGSAASNVATITVAAEASYIARYPLIGEANAAVPASIADISGASNAALAVAGVANYDAEGYINLNGTDGNILSVTGLSLGGATGYTLHLKFLSKDGVTGFSHETSHRLLYLPDIDFNLMIANNGVSDTLKVETTNTNYATTFGISGTYTRSHMAEMSLDLSVSGDMLNIIGTGTNFEGLPYTLRLQSLNVPGFTAALQSAVYIGNRADGTRAVNGRVTEFWIEGA